MFRRREPRSLHLAPGGIAVTFWALLVILVGPAAKIHAQDEISRQQQPAAGAAPSQDASVQDSPAGAVAGDDDLYVFPAFSEPVQVWVLVRLIRDDLGIQLRPGEEASLDGLTVLMDAETRVPRAKLLDFLESILSPKGFTITRDVAGLYVINRKDELPVQPGRDLFSPTQVIPTRGLEPSRLRPVLERLFGVAGEGRGGGAGGLRATYEDSLGVIVFTGSPRDAQHIRQIIDLLVEEQANFTPIPFPLTYVAPTFAIERIRQVTSEDGAAARAANRNLSDAQRAALQLARGDTGAVMDIASRLRPDPNGSAVLYLGRADDEAALRFLTRMLTIIDVPDRLRPVYYEIGASAADLVTDYARREGLGEVIEYQAIGGQDRQNNIVRRQPDSAGGESDDGFNAGPGFILYPDSGGFVYRGTPQQHERVRQIIEQFQPLADTDTIVLEFYKLQHTDAAEVSEIIQSLLQSEARGRTSDLLGEGLSRRPGGAQATAPEATDEQIAAANAEGATTIFADENTFVAADEANNQVIVRASKKLQPQFERLIQRLDLRRPQVFIEAQIVTVTNTDNFRLAVESQLIAGQFGIQSNFGLSQDRDDFLSGRDALTNLAGLTSALIKSEYMPFIVNAIKNETDARIVATPQLLADDNSEASIASVEQQPTTTTTIGETSDQTTFAGFEDAGTELTVTPSISEGGYLRLSYAITQSNFVGEGSGGVPPPRQERRVQSESVTVPSDTTIVVGGIVVTNDNNTVAKIPLLGDIPLVGALFSDQRKGSTESLLYVFITPRIMRDPSYQDLRLVSRGPLARAGITDSLPELAPVRAEIIAPVSGPAESDSSRPGAVRTRGG